MTQAEAIKYLTQYKGYKEIEAVAAILLSLTKNPTTQGEWLVDDGDGPFSIEFRCSVCNSSSLYAGLYCSQCGAKLEKPDK